MPNIGTLTDMIACPGLDFCSLANAGTLDVARQIQERFDDLDYLYDLGEIELKMSGCMNACGHHHVGHIGILGVDKHGEEWYQITLGGSASGFTALGEVIGPSVPQARGGRHARAHRRGVPRAARTTDERFVDTVRRVGTQALQGARLCATSCGGVSCSVDHVAPPRRGARPGRCGDRAVRASCARSASAGGHWDGRLGVRLAPIDRVEDLDDELPRLDLVAVEFPSPGEGRGYSQGRLLRERFGFRGELRAVGAGVRQDLVFLLARCGFDAIELAAGEDPAGRAACAQPLPGRLSARRRAQVPLRRQRFFAA